MARHLLPPGVWRDVAKSRAFRLDLAGKPCYHLYHLKQNPIIWDLSVSGKKLHVWMKYINRHRYTLILFNSYMVMEKM